MMPRGCRGRPPSVMAMATIRLVISGMQNNYSSIYLRHEFEVDSWDGIGELALRVYVDDGCIVWINGQEVARLNVSAGSKAHDDLTR